MKKIVSVLLSALMVGAAATSLPFSASAATAEQGVSDSVGSVQDCFAIDFINDSEVKIVDYLGTDETVIVPQTINGYRVVEIDYSAFGGNTTLKSIVIQEGVTKIGSFAFSGCTALTSYSLPSSATTIGYGIFSNCTSLKNATVLTAWTKMPGGTFNGCSSLESVSLPQTITSIGANEFAYCTSLKEINIPNSVKTIGNYAFSHCSELNEVIIPSSVTELGTCVFEYCHKLESVSIPDSIKEIKQYTFYDCKNLKNISLPSELEIIGSAAFDSCTALENIVLPQSTEKIDSSAFHGCTALKSITLNNGLTEIGDCCFTYCGELTGIDLPPTLKTIGTSAFCNCEKLESVTGGKAVEEIKRYAFYRTKWDNDLYDEKGKATYIGKCFYKYVPTSSQENSYRITIKEGTTCICGNAFANASALKSVFIPSSVKYVESLAFGGDYEYVGNAETCNNLEDVYYMGTEEQWNQIEFNNTYHGNDYLLDANIHFDYGNSVKAPVLYSVENTVGGVKVSWKSSDGASKYRVFRKTDSTDWKSIGTVSGTSFKDETAVSGETYYYTVRCVSPVNSSVYISDYNHTGKKTTYLEVPVLKKVANTYGGIKITWEASKGASEYYVICMTAPPRLVGVTKTTEFTVENVVPGETYRYMVRSVSSDSNYLSAYDRTHMLMEVVYTPAPVLHTPVNTTEGVKISWEPSEGAVKYRVIRKTGSGAWEGLGNTTGTSFVDKTAEPGVIYTYSVKCVNKAGTVAVSGYDPGKRIKFIEAPVISDLTKTDSGVTVTWNKPAGSNNSYKVFRKTPGGSWQSIGKTAETSFTDTTVQAGTTYFYTVRVLSSNENSYVSGYNDGKSVTV